jgi:hypothetical protein
MMACAAASLVSMVWQQRQMHALLCAVWCGVCRCGPTLGRASSDLLRSGGCCRVTAPFCGVLIGMLQLGAARQMPAPCTRAKFGRVQHVMRLVSKAVHRQGSVCRKSWVVALVAAVSSSYGCCMCCQHLWTALSQPPLLILTVVAVWRLEEG